MTSPQPTPDASTETAVIAAIETALITGALVAGTAVPLYLLLRLRALGIDDRAARAAARLALSEPVTPRRGRSAAARFAATEPLYRATYLVNAAKRMDRDLQLLGKDPHALLTAIRAERRHRDQHLAAARNRRRAAAAADRVAQRSPWLQWSTVMDGRAEPECRALNGELFTVDNPPVIDGFPVLPGAVHPNCRCRAVPFGATPLGVARTVTATR